MLLGGGGLLVGSGLALHASGEESLVFGTGDQVIGEELERTLVIEHILRRNILIHDPVIRQIRQRIRSILHQPFHILLGEQLIRIHPAIKQILQRDFDILQKQ